MARAPATPTYQPVTSSAILAYFGEAEIFSSPKTPPLRTAQVPILH